MYLFPCLSSSSANHDDFSLLLARLRILGRIAAASFEPGGVPEQKESKGTTRRCASVLTATAYAFISLFTTNPTDCFHKMRQPQNPCRLILRSTLRRILQYPQSLMFIFYLVKFQSQLATVDRYNNNNFDRLATIIIR